MRFVWLGLAFYFVVHNLIGGDLKLVLPPHQDLESWLQRRVEIRNQILSAAGMIPFPETTPLHARRFGRIETKSFAVEKITLETMPGFRLAGNLYLPPKLKGKLPAVLLAHGHWKNGRIHDAKRYSVPALLATLAARGYAVFAYDMIGYNDTQQLPHRFGETSREMLWSFGP